MALFTFWNSDRLAEKTQIADTEIKKVFDIPLLSALTGLADAALENRFETGNEAWVLFHHGIPVSFGWISRGGITIGELAKELVLPQGDAYFWNFRTLEAHRGKGFYPQLLQSMIQNEIRISGRLWIIAAPENRSSFKGIVKAGFTPVGVLAYNDQQGIVLSAFRNDDRADAGAKVFEVPLDAGPVRPCWSCYSKTMKMSTAGCQCKQNGFACACGSPGK